MSKVKDFSMSNVRSFCMWIFFFLLSGLASARLELSIIRPLGEFVTNNRELVIEGIIETDNDPSLQQITISVNTPAGVPSLGLLEDSLHSLTVDVGSPQSLTTLVVSPVFVDGLSLGPRVVNLSFSNDGQSFEDKGPFNCTSGMGQEFGEARVDFGAVIRTRFVRIDMLDGWQSDKIGIENVRFLDTAGKNVKARIRSISIAVASMKLDVASVSQAHFQMIILLREGENFISVRAVCSGEKKEEDSVSIKVVYIPEVVIEDKPIILSDGYKAELAIPAGALRPEIKKVGINPLDVDKIEWTSYADNMQIVKDTLPVLAYRVDVGAETLFSVTAKDSLERQPPGLVVDGNPEYPSTWITALSPLPVWLKMDLRNPRTIGKVIVIARVRGNVSYGPKKLSIWVSDDDISYDESARCDECDDSRTEIELPATPTARYVKMIIEDGKQGNNIQINEVELRDEEGTKIISYAQLNSVTLARPVELTIFYDDSDLTTAGVHAEKNLAIFSWNDSIREWRIVGGKVDLIENTLTVNLNYLSTFAVFEAVPPTAEVNWSHNPFSPNGDGIADTTTIFINLGKETDIRAKVEIFDYTGKLIRTLIDEETQSGHISILWDGRDENGDLVEIGPYLYQVSAGKTIRNGVLIVAK